MRRIFGLLLLGVGVFGLVVAGLVRFWVYPNGLKTPLNLDIPIIATGPAQVYDATAGQLRPVTLRADRTVRVDSSASDSKVVVVQERLCIVIQENNPPPCVSGTDPRLLTYTTDRVAAERKNAESVNNPKYGENVNGDTKVKHTGLSYKWPFHSKKTTVYQFFNPDVRFASPASYQGSEKIKGLTTYKYVSVTPTTDEDIFKGVPGTYDDTRTVWIEPLTGTIVKGVEHQVRKFRGGSLDGQTAVDLTLTFDDKTITYQANKAKDGRKQIDLVSLWLPLIGLVVGVLALAGGIYLLFFASRRHPPAEEAAPPPPAPEQGPPGYAGPPEYGEAPGYGAPPGPPETETTRPLPHPSWHR